MELDPGISALVSSNSLTTCLKEEKEECDGLPSRSSKSLPAEEGHSSVIVSGQRSDDQTIPTPTTGLQAVTNVTSVTSSNQAQPWSPKNKLFAQISDDIVKLPSHSPPIVRAENEAVNGEKATGIKTQNFSNNPNDAPDEVTEELSEKIYDIKLYRPPHVRDTTSVSRSSPAVQQTQPSEETAGGTKGRDEKPNPPNSTTHLHTTATTSSSPIHFDATLPASSANIGAASNHAPSDHETCVVLPTSESMVASEKAGSKGGFNFAEEGSMVPTPSGEKTPISFGGPQTPSKPSTTPHAYHSQQQSLVGQSPKKIQKRKKSKQASLVPSLVSQTSSGVPLVSNEHMEDGTAGPSFRSEPSVLINGTGGNSSSGRQKGVNQQNTVSNTSNNNTKPGENSRKGRKSPRNSIPPHHHYQHSPPAVLSPSNHVRRNSSSNGGNPSGGHHHHHLHSTANRNRTNAWIQTDSPNVIIESMMRTGSPVVGTASSGVTTNTNGFVNNYPLRYDNQWTRPSVDQLAVQIGVSSFFDMLPHYIDCCIGTKDTEKEVRQHVYHDVQAVVKGQFGLKADAHVYGSVVTDLALPFSDIDILVTGFHPMSPLDAIQKLSTALLEIDEGRLAELKHTLRQEVEQQKAENGDAASGHSRLGVEAGGQGCDGSQEDTAGNTLRETKDVSPFTTSPFVSPALMTSTLTPEEEAFSLPNSMEEKEHYRCREELESAEEEFRSQIVKDYTFSKKSAETLWAPISRTGSISEPTELSKGTNTEVTSTPVVPIITKMASVDSFREDSKLMERKCIRAEGEKSSAILEGMKTEGVDRAHINDAEDGDEESSSEGTRLDSSSTALALSQTSSTGTPTQRHPKKNAVRGASNEKCLSVNCSSPGSSHNDSNSVLPVTEMSTVGRATPAAAQGLPTYYTFVPTLEGPLYFVQTITSARVPVIKITEKSTKQRADITFGGGEHFRSLQMTQTLLETFPHSRPLIRFLKQCVARSGIGDSAPGGITSFAIYLMVRHVYNIVFNRLVHRSKMYAAQSNFAQGNNSGPTTCASPQVSSFLPSYDSKSCNADGVDVFLKICHEQMEHLTGKTLPCEGGKEDEALLKIEKSIRSFLGTSKDLSKEAKVLSNAIMESTQFSRTQHSTTETENQNGGLMGSTGSGAHGVDNFVSSTHHTANLPQREAEEKTAVVDDKISCTQSGNGTGLKSTANDITPTAGFYGKEESPENFVHFRSATAYLQDHMKVTHMFKEFCYYYGCQFNYESEGIRFTLEGMSEVVPKPFQCARRGQLFHLTSPFDPDYDVTARMTCMRDFQFLCEYFSRVAIPTFSFYTFLQWFSPHAYNTELLAVRDYMTRANVGASSAGMESEIASVMPATDSTVAAPGPAALPSNGAISNLAVSGGTGTSGMSGGEGGVSGEEEELTSAVVVDSVSAVASTGGDGLMQSSPLHIDVCGTTAATDSSETAVADSRFLDGSNTSTGSPQGRAFIKYPRNSGDSRRSGITTTSSKTPSPSSIVGGPELPHHHHHHHHHHLHHHQHHHHHHHHQHANSSVTGAGSIGFPSSPNGANGGKWDHYYRGYSQYVGACSPVTAGGTFIPQMYATPRGGAALSRGGPGMISPSYGNFYDANLFGYATMMSQQQHQIHQHQHQSGAAVNDFQHAQGSYMGSPSASPAPLSSVSTPGNVGTYTNGNRSGTTYPVTAAHMKATVQAANGIGEENVSKAGASTSVRSKSSSLSRPSNRSKITTKDNEPMDIAYGARSLPSPLPSPPPPPTSRITPLLDPRRQQCEALTSDRGSECAPLIERSVTAVPSNIEHNQESIPLVQEADCNIAPEDKVNLEWRE